ncbi:MAG: hypothetical protein ACI9BW_001579 [Gammaproteobacteria bacterium]|jgi:hypothetical protein
MNMIRHGLSIGIERIDNKFSLSLKAIGKLTHEDYDIITPMVESALQGVTEPKIKIFVDASEMEGWEARAAWDDFKLGLKHGSEFEKIAILGNKRWQELAAKIASWFVAGETKYFDDEQQARAWLHELPLQNLDNTSSKARLNY